MPHHQSDPAPESVLPNRSAGSTAAGAVPAPAERVGGPADLAAPGEAVAVQPVTLRAIGIAVALMPLTALWVIQSELIWYAGHPTTISLFYHVTFIMLLLALMNLAIRQRWPGRALSGGELLTIYMMLSIASTFCSHDLVQVLVPMLSFPQHNANPQNRWAELILRHVPSWAIVSDRAAAGEIAVGNNSIYTRVALVAWIRPLAFWYAFVLVLTGALLSINLLLRQQWTQKERLSFPIIQIPTMIANGLSTLLRSRLFWLAFAVAAGIDLINGLNYLYPVVPKIPTTNAMMLRDYLVERPWSSIAGTPVNIFPFVIGLAFFLPTDLAFSCWFFFIFYKLQIVISDATGLRDLPGFPFVNEQAAGGYLGVGLVAVWLSRRHLAAVGRTIFGRPGGADQSGEPMRYRAAFGLFLVCSTLLVLAGVRLGASWHMMVLFFGIFFVYSIAIARMRAELGPPAHDLHNMGPDMLIHNAIGTRAAGAGNLATFSLFFWFNRAYRAHFSAHSMEGFKIGESSRLSSRSITVAMTVAIVVGAAAAFWATLHACAVQGYAGRPAGDAFASDAWRRMEGWMTFPRDPNTGATIASGAGLAFALFLGLMRTKFAWWAWHPVGYATSTSWSMDRLWLCLFIGWLVKLLITRYGGGSAYRKAMPFFVGLVLGEFVAGSWWSIYSSIRGMPAYQFWGG